MDDFRPTIYNEDDNTTATYREGFPFVMREVALYEYNELSVLVLEDIADIMEELDLPGAENARTMASEAAALDFDDEYADYEWIADAVSYPPNGIIVDFDSDAGTVTVSAEIGWEGAE